MWNGRRGLAGCSRHERLATVLRADQWSGPADASEEQIDVEASAVLEPTAYGFSNYFAKGDQLPSEHLLADRANLLTLTGTVVSSRGVRALALLVRCGACSVDFRQERGRGSDRAGQCEELLARAGVVAQNPMNGRGNRPRPLGLHPAHGHAHVLGLDYDADSPGGEVLL